MTGGVQDGVVCAGQRGSECTSVDTAGVGHHYFCFCLYNQSRSNFRQKVTESQKRRQKTHCLGTEI